jgi:uncharacterized protein (DUF2336 family)
VSSFGSLVADLESAIHEGRQDKRVAILRQVTDLFVVGADGFNDEHAELFGDVLTRLVNQVENNVLVELSAKLAPVRNAPNAIVQRFARDDEIAIAGPVLSQSVRLSDDDLVEIAKSKGQSHLGAISERQRLAAAVTDILVERGDTDVIRKLSRNRGAAFSDSGFSAMATRAEHDEQLAENLSGRVDLPPQMLHELMAKATEQVRARLLAGAPPERRAEIQAAIDAASKRVEGEAAAPRDFTRAQRLVADMKQNGKLSHAAIEHFAHIGQYELMVAALADLCLAPIELMDPLVRSASHEGLMTACKACDFTWKTFCAVVAHRFPGHTMPVSELDKVRTDFQKMSSDTAKRIYRFWLVRGVASAH